jgi:Tfp pilus assembly protein PilO
MNQKNKITITFGFFIILAILLSGFVVLPLLKGITHNAASYISDKNEISSINAEIANLGSLKDQYSDYKPSLDKINELFISSEVPINFIRFLEGLATSSQISASISPGSPLRVNKNSWKPLYFHITARGSFLQFSRFLEKLENAPYLIEIQNLNITSDMEKTAVSADFSIMIYAK